PRRKRAGAVGFAIRAIVSALGGGMLRDTLLQAGPPVALTDPYYLGTALVGAVVAFLLPLHGRWWNRVFVLADGVVLGCWAATGATKRSEEHTSELQSRENLVCRLLLE